MRRKGMKRLSGTEFLAGRDLAFEDVEIPELGGVMRVSELSVADLSAFYDSFPKDEGGKQITRLDSFREKLLAYTIVDEGGNRLFSDENIPAIGKKSIKVIKRLFDVAQKLNGMAAEKDAIEKK
jgi:hypothetical protein